jgi:hypothetical protein
MLSYVPRATTIVALTISIAAAGARADEYPTEHCEFFLFAWAFLTGEP